MPIISSQKKDKIAEQILSHLYLIFPNQIFTSDIAKEIARDEEFIKKILISIEEKKLIIRVDKNPKGYKYSRRTRWRISNESYQAYKNLQK
jgi:predicted transcriptional regulator with HTH domain